MPRLDVILEPTTRAEQVVPAELGVRATIANRGDEPAEFHVHQARHASLVLEVRDEGERPILLPPPTPPDERDLAPPDRLAPGESVTIEYVNFLDAALPKGRYRVRYFSEQPLLGGERSGPLASGWLAVTLADAAIVQGVAVGEPRRPAQPSRFTIVWRLLERLRRLLHRLACIVRRILGRRCNRVHRQEVDEPRTQTMANAPPEAAAWNRTSAWRARFLLTVDEANCRATATVRVRLLGAITAEQQTAWETAIEAAWNDRFKLCCHCCCCTGGYAFVADIRFVASSEHQVVNVAATTENMGNWAADDTVDVRHEFGHMLGALDEYFTVDGTDWGPGRQADGSIMNNPANEPEARHFEVVLSCAQGLLGTTCAARRVAEAC